MSSRYGGRTPGYRAQRDTRIPLRGWLALGVVIVLAIAGAAYFAFRPAHVPTTAENVAFSRIDSNRAVVSFNITPDRQRDTVCAVVAKNEFEAVVGYAEVTIPAEPQAKSADGVHKRVELNTTQRSVQGHLDSCWFVG